MKTILISGAGIAGPTLAFWLRAAGFVPTLVERAPGLRAGGYVIDFWGLGFDIAERMRLIEQINCAGYHVKELRIIDDAGRRRAGFGTRVFTELTGGRYVTLPRSELSRLLFERIGGCAECIFGDEIIGLREEMDGILVRLKHAGERRFDLVIGADGLHSNVRRLAFGPSAQFEKYLGYGVAAFEAQSYRPRDNDVYLMYGQPSRMTGRFTLHGDSTLFLFVFAAPNTALPAKSHRAKGAHARDLRRLRLGMSENTGRTGACRDDLPRPGEPDQNGKLDARPRRTDWRCRLLRIPAGRSGLCACDDFGLCASGRACRCGRGISESICQI